MSEQTSRSLLHSCAEAFLLYNRESNTACLFQTVFQCLCVHRIRAISDTFPVCGLLDLKLVSQVWARSNECRALCSISDFLWSGIWYLRELALDSARWPCVVFYGFLKSCAFIKGAPAQIFYLEISVYITHLHLGPKLDFRILLSTNNGPYPKLRETDDPA